MKLKILSWNVNGFRAVVKKGFYDFLRAYSPDILCIQETKQSEKPTLSMGSKYSLFWYAAEKKGYAGIAVFSKIKPEKVEYGIGKEEFDKEGRILTLDFGKFYLVNVYFPHAQRGLTRMDFKLKFDREIEKYFEELKKKKSVIICGDFNVAHKEIDIARPKDNVKNAGFTPEERTWMDKFLPKGYIDSFRHLHPNETGKYSWWSYRFKARERNIGWRVDYVIISKDLEKNLKDAFILDKIQGSDHAPVGVEIEI